MTLKLENKLWWEYIGEDLQELLLTSKALVEKVSLLGENFDDYSFVVFPAAKAYEGFLKKLFLDLGFITKEDYYGKRFRVGKALNPDLEPYLREKEGVYDRIVAYCGGKDLADRFWNTWKLSRNLIFHWFPNEKNIIDLEEAKARLGMIIEALDLAVKECKIKFNR